MDRYTWVRCQYCIRCADDNCFLSTCISFNYSIWYYNIFNFYINKNKIEESQHPHGMPSFFYGLSHGLKIARQLSIFTQPLAGSPFRVLSSGVPKKEERRKPLLFFWYTGRDSNPQPSEPESDALSIEPPVHLLDSLAIIADFTGFVKG